MKRNTIYALRLWNLIFSILCSLILVGMGSMLSTGKWVITAFQATGSVVIGYVIIGFSVLSLLTSLIALILHRS